RAARARRRPNRGARLRRQHRDRRRRLAARRRRQALRHDPLDRRRRRLPDPPAAARPRPADRRAQGGFIASAYFGRAAVGAQYASLTWSLSLPLLLGFALVRLSRTTASRVAP